MKYCIMFFLLILFAMQTSQVNASETRVFSMGQVGLFMHDNSNVTPFPGTIMRYGNEVVTELRFKDFEPSYSAEVRIPINSYMVGVNFNRPLFIPTPGIGNFVQLTNTSDFYLGTQLMDYDVALRVSLGRDGFNRDSTLGVPMLDESATYLEFAGGFSSDNLDAILSFELPSIKSETGNLKDEWNGTGINAMGRYFYQLNDEMEAVPVVAFGTSSTTRKTDQPAGLPQLDTDFSTTRLSAGIGLNYHLNEDNLIVLAVDPYGLFKVSTDVKDVGETITTTTTFPRLYLGVETRVKGWLVGRVGANRAYQTIKTENKPDQGDVFETSFQTSTYNVSFGLGIQFGKFLIDLDINDGMLFEGPNFISGRLRDVANQVSVSYVFSKK